VAVQPERAVLFSRFTTKSWESTITLLFHAVFPKERGAMNKAMHFGCGAMLLLLLVTLARPTIIPALSVPDLVEGADVIVIGHIDAITERGRISVEVGNKDMPARLMAAQINVDKSLKGSPNSSLVVEFAIPEGASGYGRLSPNTYRMMFLKRTPAGYTFVSPYYGSLGAVPDVPLNSDSPLENVTLQLRGVLENATASQSEKMEAIYALDTIRTPSGTKGLKRMLTDKSLDLQLTASALLLARNDLAGLELAESTLTTPGPGVSSNALRNLRAGIVTGVKDPEAVPALSRLLRVANTDTRRAAVYALRRTGAQSALPALAEAISDTDPQVRLDGMKGLAEITNQAEWHPKVEGFNADEAKYLQYWKDWVQQKGLFQEAPKN